MKYFALFLLLINIVLIPCRSDYNVVEAKVEPEIEYVYVQQEVIKFRDIIKYKEVPVIRYVDRDVYHFKEPKQFKDVAELENYLGSITAYMPMEGQDCDDIARFFMLDALKAGFLVSMEIIDNYRGMGCHMLCSAVIGNNIYYIEPSNKQYWWAMPLD